MVEVAVEILVTLLYRVTMALKDQLAHVDLMATQELKVLMELMEKMVMQDPWVHEATQDTVTTNQESQDLLGNLVIKDRRYVVKNVTNDH